MPASVERRSVSRDDIRKFAVAIGADDPVHHDPLAAKEAGYRDVVAPSSFFLALGLSHARIVGREDLGDEGLPVADDLSGRRVVAGQTAVRWYGDIVAGDEITVVQRLLRSEAKQGRTGRLDLFTYERTYARADTLLIREEFTRIAR